MLIRTPTKRRKKSKCRPSDLFKTCNNPNLTFNEKAVSALTAAGVSLVGGTLTGLYEKIGEKFFETILKQEYSSSAQLTMNILGTTVGFGILWYIYLSRKISDQAILNNLVTIVVDQTKQTKADSKNIQALQQALTEMSQPKTIGQRLKKARLEAEFYNIDSFLKKLNGVIKANSRISKVISKAQYEQLEKDHANLDDDIAKHCAKILKVTTEYLLKGIEERDVEENKLTSFQVGPLVEEKKPLREKTKIDVAKLARQADIRAKITAIEYSMAEQDKLKQQLIESLEIDVNLDEEEMVEPKLSCGQRFIGFFRCSKTTKVQPITSAQTSSSPGGSPTNKETNADLKDDKSLALAASNSSIASIPTVGGTPKGSEPKRASVILPNSDAITTLPGSITPMTAQAGSNTSHRGSIVQAGVFSQSTLATVSEKTVATAEGKRGTLKKKPKQKALGRR